jgi:hypothetical protein
MSRAKIIRFFLLIGLLLFAIPTKTVAQTSAPIGNDSSSPQAPPDGRLQLSTSITKEQYCFDGYSPRLQLTLRLGFTNVGSTRVLLDKSSSVIERSLVSRNSNDAAAKKYLAETTYSYNLGRILREGLPDESFFVTLEPNESYSLDKDLGQLLYDGTKDSRDDLHPGNYVLQIRVGTWSYALPSEPYRKLWREKGFLWTKMTTSLPMPFTVVKQRQFAKCPSMK